MGAYCFFATKPGVNFDYDVLESSGQLVFGGKHDGKKSGDPTGSPDNLCLFSEQPLGLSLSRTRDFVLTRANVDDRQESVIDTLTDKVFGKLYADKGYISQSLFGHLWDKGCIS